MIIPLQPRTQTSFGSCSRCLEVESALVVASAQNLCLTPTITIIIRRFLPRHNQINLGHSWSAHSSFVPFTHPRNSLHIIILYIFTCPKFNPSHRNVSINIIIQHHNLIALQFPSDFNTLMGLSLQRLCSTSISSSYRRPLYPSRWSSASSSTSIPTPTPTYPHLMTVVHLRNPQIAALSLAQRH